MAGAVYRRVWAVRTVRVPFVASCSGRLSFAVLTLALILLVERATGSFGAAGLVTGSFSATLTVFAPARARLLDRAGAPRGLISLTVPYLAGLAVLVVSAEKGSGTAVLVGTAAAAGAFAPPLGPAMRVLWADLVRDEERLRAAYALDTVVEEVAFTAGPLVAAVVIAAAGPVWAMVVVMALIGAGTAGFVVSCTPDGTSGERREKGRRAPLALPGMQTLVVAFGGVGLAVGVLEVALPYMADKAGSAETGGVLLALLSAGSAVGGLWYGKRSWRTMLTTRFNLLMAAFSLALLPLAFATGPILTGIFVFVLGLAVAPLFTSAYLLVAELTASSSMSPTEANTWVSTANNGGAAAGAALAGLLLDPYGHAITFTLIFAGTAVITAAAFLRRGTLTIQP